MRGVVGYLVKGVLKNKYFLLLPVGILLITSALLLVNYEQTGTTLLEKQEQFQDRSDSLDFLIGKTLNKKRHVGLPDEQQQALDSLLTQENLIKDISQDLHDGNLGIAANILGYIEEYQNYKKLQFIDFENDELLEAERKKAQILVTKHLSYTEKESPVDTALFTKQLMELLLNPITALLFLLVFCFIYNSDTQNRTFDFFVLHSLSNPVIYYGYLTSFFIYMIGYILFVSSLALLPPLVTGNLATIHYPLEVMVGSETTLVPVWKWLIYLPVGWAIFVSLLLILAVWFCKQRLPFATLLSVIVMPVLIGCLLSFQFGFRLANPIHLVLSYTPHLLVGYQFVPYLASMILVIIVGLCVSYPIFSAKNTLGMLPGQLAGHKRYKPWIMWKLLRFEHLKKRRSHQALFVFVLLLIFCGGTSIFVNYQIQKLPHIAIKAIENLENAYIQGQTEYKVLAEEALSSSPIRNQESNENVQESEEYLAMMELYSIDKRKADMLGELKRRVSSPGFLDDYSETMRALDDYPSYKEIEQTQWSITTMASEEQWNLLNDKSIDAWPIGDLWVSNFDNPKTAEHFKEKQEGLLGMQERNTKYGNSALFTSYRFFTWNVPWLVLAVFILFLWTSMAEERKPIPTAHFLSTQPLRLRSVYISKSVYNLMVAYVLLFVAGGLVFLLSSLLGGIGDARYPILTYATKAAAEGAKAGMFYSPVDLTYFSFEGLGSLLVKCLILMLAQIFFLNGLFGLLGRWMNHPYAAILTTLFLTIAGVVAASQIPAHDLMVFNPFLYFDTWNIADGWKSVKADSASVNVLTGCLVLVIGGFALFLLGLLSPGKKVS